MQESEAEICSDQKPLSLVPVRPEIGRMYGVRESVRKKMPSAKMCRRGSLIRLIVCEHD